MNGLGYMQQTIGGSGNPYTGGGEVAAGAGGVGGPGFGGSGRYGPGSWGRAGGGGGPGVPGGAPGSGGDGSGMGEARRKPENAPAVRSRHTAIAVPQTLVVAAGEAAWYPLIYLPIDDRFGDELCIIQVEIEQMPPDVDGGGGGVGGTASAMAWGTAKGEGALIVAGFNLPIDPNGWRSAPCRYAGLDSSVTAVQYDDDVPAVIDFPSGKYSDTAPFKRWTPLTMPGWGQRAGRGDIFSVALVLPRATGNIASTAGADKVIYGNMAATVRAVRSEQ